MVLAWIYRNIFALCVLQVGSLLAVAGRRVQKVRGVQEERGNAATAAAKRSAKPTW